MSVLALHLWREWREHRFALVSLAVALPLGTWILSTALSRAFLGDTVFQLAVAFGFAVVLLVVVGGELLGAERRGPGLRWLERLPSGLATAFRAKLALLLVGLVSTTAYGYAVAWLVGRLRHARALEPRGIESLALVVLVFGLWTFSASVWAVRGGLAVIAAALLLAAIGFPVARVIDATYQPTTLEFAAFVGLLVACAGSGAWLAFVRGARLGRGAPACAALALAPALVAFAMTTTWAAMRMAERETFDPLHATMSIASSTISDDGRVAFVVGRSELGRWQSLPHYSLRVDLEHGTAEQLGEFRSQVPRFRGDQHALSLLCEFMMQGFLVSGVDIGEPLPFESGDRLVGAPHRRGLGSVVRGAPTLIHDPFRGRDYPESRFNDWLSSVRLLVRPGRWLVGDSNGRWQWFDPDTDESTPADWPAGSCPLVVFGDGRILLKNPEQGLQVIHPELGLSTTLDTQGVPVEDIYANPFGSRFPREPRNELDDAGTIILITSEQAWLVIDAEATSVRRLPVPESVMFLRRVGSDAAIVCAEERLARLDLVTGEMKTLWPLRSANSN